MSVDKHIVQSQEQPAPQEQKVAAKPTTAALPHTKAKKSGVDNLKLEDTRPHTPGDTFYDVAQFITGKLFILGVTAALAFTADGKHGPDKILGMPNYLKKLQNWAEKTMHPMTEWGTKAGKVVNQRKHDVGVLLAAGTASTLVLSHGGNFFAPIIKELENRREQITNWYNKKWGTPEDVRITHEKYRDMPQQNWGDVIKGRAWAWATVFSSVTGAFLIGGRSKTDPSKFKLQRYEEWVGRKFAWLSKGSRDIARTPMTKKLSEAQQANKVYRFGKVAAIDAFATTMAIIVWNTVSRLSAKNRVAAEKKANGHTNHSGEEAAGAQEVDAPQQGVEQQEENKKQFTDSVKPNTNREDALASKSEEKPSFTNAVSEQRAAAEDQKAPALNA